MDLFKYFLKQERTNPNNYRSCGFTPLHWAVAFKNIEAVKALLDHPKTNPTLLSFEESEGPNFRYGKLKGIGYLSPLEVAQKRNYKEITSLLKKFTEDFRGKDPLFIKVHKNPNFQHPFGETRLSFIAEGGNINLARKLLSNPRTDPNIQDIVGDIALHRAVDKGSLEIINILINDTRTNPNIQDIVGDIALHRAVDKGNLEIINILINDPRTNPFIRNREGKTPLDLAKELVGGRDMKEVIQRLERAGAAFAERQRRSEEEFSASFPSEETSEEVETVKISAGEQKAQAKVKKEGWLSRKFQAMKRKFERKPKQEKPE